VCVSEGKRDREREKETERATEKDGICMCVCVCVCVCVRALVQEYRKNSPNMHVVKNNVKNNVCEKMNVF